MKIGVITYGGDGGKSGISRYIISLMQEFARSGASEEISVFAFQDEKDLFLPRNSSFRLIPGSARIRHPVSNILWHQSVLPRYVKREALDVVFIPAANRRIPYYCPVPMVGTVHDFSALHVKTKYDPARSFYIRHILPPLVRRLNHVITISQSSRRDIMEFVGVPPDKIDVTPLAADGAIYFPRAKEESQKIINEQYGISGTFILYVSRLEHPGKNHVCLIRAFTRMKEATSLPHKLVLAGSEWSGAAAVYAEAAASSARDSIIFTGFVNDADLPYLYSGAEFLAFPSLYEGFGLPVLEAMACGTPVACSNTSSLPEVAANAAQLFSPDDVSQMADVLAQLAQDEELREHLKQAGIARAAQFSWRKTATATLDVLRRAAEEAFSTKGADR